MICLRWRCLASVAMCTLFACPSTVLETPIKIVFLGDSVTYGVRPEEGVRDEHIFAALVESQLKRKFSAIEVVNSGVPGNNTRDVFARLKRDVLVHRPSYVFVMLGLNDAHLVDQGLARKGPRVPLAEFKRNMKKIVARCQKGETKVVLLTPNPITRRYIHSGVGLYRGREMNFLLRDYVGAIMACALQSGTPVIDIFSMSEHERDLDELLSDGMHPNTLGHRVIANVIEQFLINDIAQTLAK